MPGQGIPWAETRTDSDWRAAGAAAAGAASRLQQLREITAYMKKLEAYHRAQCQRRCRPPEG